MEKRGIPTVTCITSEFITLAETCAIGLGVDNLPIAVIEHPLAGIDPKLAYLKADNTFEDILDKATLHMPQPSYSQEDPYPAPMVNVTDTIEAVNELFYENAWCDGLPIIPPTKERVRRMLAAVEEHYSPDQLIGVIPPRMGAATVQNIAINAVMAGAKPEHMLVIIAAVEAALKPEVELRRWQSTTRPSCLTVFVQGPIVKELGIHYGQSALFPSPKPNVAIGRAFNLTMHLLGGVISHADKIGTMTTFGLPIHSSCIGENEDALPEGWDPLRLESGFSREDSVVSIFGTTIPLLQNDHDSTDSQGVLMTSCDLIAGQLGRAGGEDPGGMVLLFGPEHAATIASGGYSKEDVKKFIFENAKTPREKIIRSGLWYLNYEDTPEWIRKEVEKGTPLIHQFDSPEQITISVAGGFGKQSVFRVGYKNPPPVLIKQSAK